MKTKHCFHLGGWLGKTLIYTEKIFCCVKFILFNLNFTFILSLNLSCFNIPIAGDVQKLCYLHYEEYLLLNKGQVHL